MKRAGRGSTTPHAGNKPPAWPSPCRGRELSHHLSPPLAPALHCPHPSSMRTRAADRLLLGAREAAPEENREAGVRPHLRKSGLAFRGRCNGPPQGLVCPPPGLESPGPSLPSAITPPAEEAVSEGKGLNISPQAGRREAAQFAQRTRPLGAPQSSLRGGRMLFDNPSGSREPRVRTRHAWALGSSPEGKLVPGIQ